ncbi:MAG: sn-glycerol-3-phosphate ABC transporter ATP-binding protein UgpC [Chloroflexota bacterium]|nr:sn-glycerol-3-phosphate ABC transporter ATP-binding protein UgpC [Chloroflexota bacterium]
MARVVFENVYKRFDEVTAVNNLNLDINDQEFLVLVGPSGCGKTTALRMLAGLEEISDGNIYIGDRRVNDVPPRDRDIAMVFQNYALYPHMTVYDNMAFALKLRRVNKGEIERRVREAADILGIEPYLKRRPKALSGGQRQRVALGRAIVREPAAFLMDEPLSNLDAKLRVQTRAEIQKLHRRLGVTTIYVTHDQVEAMTMGDRIAVMKEGLLQQFDTPQTLYDNPANMFVAGFIGSPAMNFMQARIETDGEALYVADAVGATSDFQLRVPREYERRIADLRGQQVIFGIRPENIELQEFAEPEWRDCVVPSRVEVLEPLGSEIQLHATAAARTDGNGAGGDPIIGAEETDENEVRTTDVFVARVDPRVRVRSGDLVPLAFNMRYMHVFDPQTQEALV